jgi:hypothetical protein
MDRHLNLLFYRSYRPTSALKIALGRTATCLRIAHEIFGDWKGWRPVEQYMAQGNLPSTHCSRRLCPNPDSFWHTCGCSIKKVTGLNHTTTRLMPFCMLQLSKAKELLKKHTTTVYGCARPPASLSSACFGARFLSLQAGGTLAWIVHTQARKRFITTKAHTGPRVVSKSPNHKRITSRLDSCPLADGGAGLLESCRPIARLASTIRLQVLFSGCWTVRQPFPYSAP